MPVFCCGIICYIILIVISMQGHETGEWATAAPKKKIGNYTIGMCGIIQTRP